MDYQIKSMAQLKSLKEKNFNTPYTQRNFKVFDNEVFKQLILDYKDSFAFGVKFNANEYTLFRGGNEIFIRNDNMHKFEFPHCPPPITNIYDIKSSNINDIMNFVIG